MILRMKQVVIKSLEGIKVVNNKQNDDGATTYEQNQYKHHKKHGTFV